jgi:ComF family protein
MIIKEWISDLACLFFPATCGSCATPLFLIEHAVCTRCRLELDPTDHFVSERNQVERLFEGRACISSAGALYYLPQGGVARRLIHSLKYKERPDIGIWLGEMLGRELIASGRLTGVDLIIPVPADKKRLRQRTYNQCDLIAEGIADITSLPVASDVLVRNSSSGSQTRLGRVERWRNSQQQYVVNQSQKIVGKSVLLVDDVVTTGATLIQCIDILHQSRAKEIHIAVVGSPSES